MIRQHRPQVILAVILVALLLVAAVYRVQTRGIPFIRTHDNWSLGVYVGDTPFALSQPDDVRNPVLTILDVTDVPAHFLADPSMVYEGDTWYMFFEVYNLNSHQGDIAVATSPDGRNWQYEQIVLDEPFHLSYPYVFQWQGEYYMVPESWEADSVRLYIADDFPFQWRYVATLLEGDGFLDNSLAYYNDHWWLISSFDGNDMLRLYHAPELFGPWQEHPESPVIEDNPHYARPGGRLLVYDGRLFRYAQDSVPRYGSRMWAFEITDISSTTYSEQLVSDTLVVEASGSGWNKDAMHAVDPIQLPDGRWLSPVDGSGPIRIVDMPLGPLGRLTFILSVD
jgi:hypothetical protein